MGIQHKKKKDNMAHQHHLFFVSLMELISFTLSTFLRPSEEGTASALFIIEQIINLFDVDSKHTEFEALEADKNDINNKHHHQMTKSADSSSSNRNHDEICIDWNGTVISASNVNDIDINKISDFSTKSKEMMAELQRLECLSWKFHIVPKDFYSQDIEFRAKHILRAPSIEYLCKSLLMKNTKCIHNDCNDRLNSKYYLVLFQYDKKLKQQKLKKFVKALSDKSNKHYKFSLAPSDETLNVTGFEYNCVSPIGVGNIPLIISHHIIHGKYQNIWIGSGSLNIKLSIDTKELCQKYTHFVADITQ